MIERIGEIAFTLAIVATIFILAIAETKHAALAPVVSAAAETRSPYDEAMLALDREALDIAYRQQLVHLFGTWMKDDFGQPRRAITGANQARRAYIAVMEEIIRREQAVKP